MRGMGCASFIVAALGCLNSTQNCRLPSFIFTMTTGEAQVLLEGRMTLLDLGHLFPTNSGVLAAIWLAERGSLCLDGVWEQRGTAQIVLPLANNVAEFLEEGLHLLLLGGRQVHRDRRWAMWTGSGWWQWRVSDGDDFQGAHGLPGM